MPADSRLLADRYRLLRVVASGGMGQVWEASDELLGRTVAIKEVRFPSGVPDEERAVMGERTMREAKLTARLAHRGIITIYDVIRVDERPYIVMELVRAASLAREVDEHGPLPPEQVADIGLQLLDALAAAHRQGILHRDVKPSNVLLAPDRVVLTDFGIATTESDTTLTSTGLLVGSPTYMSPERLRGEGIGPPADLWSLGATLYAALEGQPPFRSTTTMGTITAVLVDSPHPLHVAGPLAEAVLGLLDKDVEHRLTGAQAENLLRRSLEQPGPVVQPPGGEIAPAAAEQPVMAPVVSWDNPIRLDGADLPDPSGSALEAAPRRSFSFVAAPPAASGPDAPYDDSRSPLEGYGDDWAGDDDGRSQRRRRVGWLTALTVLVATALAAVLAWTQLSGGDQSPTSSGTTTDSAPLKPHRTKTAVTPPTEKTSTTPTTRLPPPSQVVPPTTPTSALSTSPLVSTSAPVPTATATGPAPAVPDGYQLVSDPLGFQVAVPNGWTRRTSGSRVDYVSPTNSAQYLRIDQIPKAGPSAVGAWVDYEPSLADRLPGYRRIRLESVPFRQWEAADLEFTWQGTNGTLHVLDRGFITDPRGFAILMSGPDSTWESQSRPVFDVAAATFLPTS